MATISIDFDDTYTLDPTLWDQFIVSAAGRGHRIICVTARSDTQVNRMIVKATGLGKLEVPVYFTSHRSKKWYVEEIWKLKVDVWIDDRPEVVVNGV